MADAEYEPDVPAAATGIPGLDDVLGGGFPAHHLHLVEGAPGTGKTTLALRFLLEGVQQGERALYVSLAETARELRTVARRHGWSIEAVNFHEVITSEESRDQSVMYHSSEVELSETVQQVLAQIEATQPARVVIDSLSELRLLAQNSLRYRRQMLALKRFFDERQCTVLLLDDQTAGGEDLQVQSIAHGVVVLEQMTPEYGGDRRRLRVRKLRGTGYRSGYHDFILSQGGLAVFPRLVAAEHPGEFHPELLPSGIAALDTLLAGGLVRGTSTLVLGPAGIGKSSLAMQYAVAAAERGEHAAIFLFDETVAVALARTRGLGLPIEEHVQAGRIHLQQINPAELSPGEFAAALRRAVESDGATVVVVDSVNGYLNAMPEEQFLTLQLHELLTYLNQRGVVTLLVVAQHGLVGTMQTPIDVSYLTDTVILLRYFEDRGRVRQAIAVVKKRVGGHERTLRELHLGREGITIGEPLLQFQGVLTGIPTLDPSDPPPREAPG
jgi:circadian clock protein KaiC